MIACVDRCTRNPSCLGVTAARCFPPPMKITNTLCKLGYVLGDVADFVNRKRPQQLYTYLGNWSTYSLTELDLEPSRPKQTKQSNFTIWSRFHNLDHILQFQPDFTMLTKFDNFNQISQFQPNFNYKTMQTKFCDSCNISSSIKKC